MWPHVRDVPVAFLTAFNPVSSGCAFSEGRGGRIIQGICAFGGREGKCTLPLAARPTRTSITSTFHLPFTGVFFQVLIPQFVFTCTQLE